MKKLKKIISDDEEEIEERSIEHHKLSKVSNHKNKNQKIIEDLKKESLKTMKDKNISKEDKLKFLMKQVDIYTHFLLSHHLRKQNSDQKKSKSKHRQHEDDDVIDEEDNEEYQTTRLYTQPSSLAGGSLRQYQLDSLNWMVSLYENSLNGILADEMGLGKTIQTISLVSYITQFKKILSTPFSYRGVRLAAELYRQGKTKNVQDVLSLVLSEI